MRSLLMAAAVLGLVLASVTATGQEAPAPVDADPPKKKRGDKGARAGRVGELGQRGQLSGQRGQGVSGERGGAANPLMTALDLDRDGSLSAKEIAGASKALLKLDRNGDGSLSREELRPEDKTRMTRMIQQLMSFDKDKDGRLSRDETPERYERLFDRGDANEDGFLDAAEIEAVASRMTQRRGGAAGEAGSLRERGIETPALEGTGNKRKGRGKRRGDDQP